MFFRYSILLICICAILYVQSSNEKTPCGYKTTMTSQLVIEYCNKTGGQINHGCCYIAGNGTFAAVDLSDAKLTSVPSFDFRNFESSVIVIDLRLNTDLELQKDAFMNLTNLYDLYLPTGMKCPGGLDAWYNITDIDNGIHCEHQRDLCLTIENPCPKKVSECSANGPNEISCTCKPGYKGYKCLRSGNFPWVAFTVPTGVVTVLASFLLWWTHRRHVKSD